MNILGLLARKPCQLSGTLVPYSFGNAFTHDLCWSSPRPCDCMRQTGENCCSLFTEDFKRLAQGHTARCQVCSEFAPPTALISFDCHLHPVQTSGREVSTGLLSQGTKGRGEATSGANARRIHLRKKNCQAWGRGVWQPGKDSGERTLREMREELAVVLKLCCIFESPGNFKNISAPSSRPMLIKSASLKVEVGLGIFKSSPGFYSVQPHLKMSDFSVRRNHPWVLWRWGFSCSSWRVRPAIV